MTGSADGFQEKPFMSSLEDTDIDEGQQVWLLRLPRKFPVDKLPKKLTLKLDADPAAPADVAATTISVKGKKYGVVSATNTTELTQLHSLLSDGTEMEFGPAFTRQINIVEEVPVPKLKPQKFKKPHIPPFAGTLTLQGTPSGYGTCPVKSNADAPAATRKDRKTGRPVAKPAKRSSSSAQNNTPKELKKKAKREQDETETEADSMNKVKSSTKRSKKEKKGKKKDKKKKKKKSRESP